MVPGTVPSSTSSLLLGIGTHPPPPTTTTSLVE